MMPPDATRLCIRLHHQDATTCQTPHLGADILNVLKKKGYDVRVTSVSSNAMTLIVNAQEVCIRVQTSDASQEWWYSITANGKAVCITPFRTDTVITHVTDGVDMFPISEILYRMWARGTFPATERDLLDGVMNLTGIHATHSVAYPMTYINASSFVEAIDLILKATSKA